MVFNDIGKCLSNINEKMSIIKDICICRTRPKKDWMDAKKITSNVFKMWTYLIDDLF